MKFLDNISNISPLDILSQNFPIISFFNDLVENKNDSRTLSDILESSISKSILEVSNIDNNDFNISQTRLEKFNEISDKRDREKYQDSVISLLSAINEGVETLVENSEGIVKKNNKSDDEDDKSLLGSILDTVGDGIGDLFDSINPFDDDNKKSRKNKNPNSGDDRSRRANSVRDSEGHKNRGGKGGKFSRWKSLLPDLPSLFDSDIPDKTKAPSSSDLSASKTSKIPSPTTSMASKASKLMKSLGKVGGKAIPVAGTILSIGSGVLDFLSADSDSERMDAIGDTGGALAGAATGAAAGAAIGSVIPILGTAIGGLLGGAVGGIMGSGLGKSIMGLFKDPEDYIPDEIKDLGLQAQIQYIDEAILPQLLSDPETDEDDLEDFIEYRSSLVEKLNEQTEEKADLAKSSLKTDKVEELEQVSLQSQQTEQVENIKDTEISQSVQQSPSPTSSSTTPSANMSAPSTQAPKAPPVRNMVHEMLSRENSSSEATVAPRYTNSNSDLGKISQELGIGDSGSSSIGTAPSLDLSNINTNVPVPQTDGSLGSYVKKFESGSRGPSAVGWDSTGGTSFGSYQIATRTGTMNNFLKFAKNKGEFGSKLVDALSSLGNLDTGKKGPAAQVWKQFAAIDGGKPLHDLERAFIYETHMKPALDKLNPEAKKLVESDRGLQEALWSTSVQHGAGGARKIFNSTFNPDPKEWLKAIYLKRSTQFGSSTPAVRQSVLNRYKEELPIVLGLSGTNEENQNNQLEQADGNNISLNNSDNSSSSGNGGSTETPSVVESSPTVDVANNSASISENNSGGGGGNESISSSTTSGENISLPAPTPESQNVVLEQNPSKVDVKLPEPPQTDSKGAVPNNQSPPSNTVVNQQSNDPDQYFRISDRESLLYSNLV